MICGLYLSRSILTISQLQFHIGLSAGQPDLSDQNIPEGSGFAITDHL